MSGSESETPKRSRLDANDPEMCTPVSLSVPSVSSTPSSVVTVC